MLEQLGMDTSILPEVTGDVAVLGKYKGIPVTAALGDNQASFLGSVGFRENTILLNMGTGGQISVLSDQLFSGEGIEASPFVNGKYLLVGASLCGGRAYATLEKFFRRFMKRATGNDEHYMDFWKRWLVKEKSRVIRWKCPHGLMEPESIRISAVALQT